MYIILLLKRFALFVCAVPFENISKFEQHQTTRIWLTLQSEIDTIEIYIFSPYVYLLFANLQFRYTEYF